jgi:carbamoyltransferase
MAPYGLPDQVDLSEFISVGAQGVRVNDRHLGLALRRNGRVRMFSDRLEELWGPARTSPRLGEPDVHIACAVQRNLEDAAEHIARNGLAEEIKKTGRLCLAGGVALNVKMNRRLLDKLGLREIFIPPAAHDGGCALGAAAAVCREACIGPCTPFLGPEFSPQQVKDELDRRGVGYHEADDPAGSVAERLARGEIVGFFHGPMEYGPRSLGSRSILAHPGLRGTADRLNRTVKFREPWRPFCPSILRDAVGDITGDDRPSPYMTLGFPVTEEWAGRIDQVVHVDGSTRPQTVTPRENPLLFETIGKFEKLTGLPAVLNTSLNRRGEPIVCTPGQALDVFFASGMDACLVFPFLVDKRGI